MKFSNRDQRVYDLEERTVKLAETIIDLVRQCKESIYNRDIISQLVRCSGSVGANYCEANEAESRKDFIHKIGICKKEIKETKHWLRLLARVHPEHVATIRIIWREVQELLLIFSRIKQSTKKSSGN
ncbi:MAG: four helix bundle protein [Candidatus Jacksonbacteria bacterium]|nr:four helix bundle protein [Candidatus Jacksonbacteria bacterium]